MFATRERTLLMPLDMIFSGSTFKRANQTRHIRRIEQRAVVQDFICFFASHVYGGAYALRVAGNFTRLAVRDGDNVVAPRQLRRHAEFAQRGDNGVCEAWQNRAPPRRRAERM